MTSVPVVFREPGLWVSVWRLLRLRLAIFFNGFRRASLRRKIGTVIAMLGFTAFLGFILFISISILGAMQSPELTRYVGDTASFLESIPSMLVSIAAIGILLTSFGVLLQALYLMGDMDFLMSAPLPTRAVFIAKLVQAILPNFGMICLFTLPILFGLGISSGYNYTYYPLVVLILALISLAAASLASLLVMVAARFVPARRLAEVLGFVVGTAFFIFGQSARFMNYDFTEEQIGSFLTVSDRFNQPWSPMMWAGQGLVELGKGDWLTAGELLIPAILLTGVVFYLALMTSEKLYATGWSNLQNNRRRPKSKTSEAAIPTTKVRRLNPIARLLPQANRAIIVKDFLLYRRELRNVSRLITPLILGVVYAFGLLSSGGQASPGQGEAPAWFMDTFNSIMVYADVMLALFIGWMLIANLAGLGFSMEGRSYWMLKSAPVSTRQLLASKFLVSYLPALALCSVYLVVLQIIKGASVASAVISLLAVALSLAGLTGIFLAFGTYGAKFDWDNPARINQSMGCVSSLVSMLFMAVCFGLFIVPAIVATLLGLPALVGQLVGLLLGGAANVAAVLIPLGLAEKKVTMLGEG
jgi:ABC-2 type transport system permease protein